MNKQAPTPPRKSIVREKGGTSASQRETSPFPRVLSSPEGRRRHPLLLVLMKG